MKAIIKNIKFSYFDKKYKFGPNIEFISELEVPSLKYEDIVTAIQMAHPEFEDVKVMSFSK
jgi:hypothetical protein